MQIRKKLRKALCVLLSIVQITPFLFSASRLEVNASAKSIQLEQVQRMALSKSSDLTKTYNEILLKKMQYTESVEGIKAKVKNLRSFRWTPLLSFKFPESLNMSEEYDLNIKPLNLQTEINTLQHKLEKQEYEVLAEVNKAYLDVFINQEKAAFTEKRLQSAQTELSRNQARLTSGLASQADVDSMQSSVDTLTNDLAQQKRNLQTSAQTLGDLIKLDVSSGYTFKNPLKDVEIPRSDLAGITEYTLKNNQTCYEAQMAASTALLNLNSYESLMKSQYGSKLNYVQSFVNTVRQGGEVDYAAFQMKYKEMLNALDAPWNGSIRILFFKFTKEWFKGEISGTRYIEDDMYALMTACKEYENARSEQESIEKSTTKQVASSYEAIITARNAYQALEKTKETTKKDLERLSALNQLGKAEYSEVQEKKEDYQSIQLDALDALASYNELLYDFDALTCGAVTKYMTGVSVSTDVGSGGDSYLETGNANVPYYYIYTDISDMVFVFGLDVPEDFEPEITHYEIWYNGTQIGSRTAVNEQIRHLALDYQDTCLLTVRLYQNDKFMSECEIDTTVARDVLPIQSAEITVETEKQGGTYTVSTTPLGNLSTSGLALNLDASIGAKYYKLESQSGESIYTSDPVPVEDSFTYLTLLISSLETVNLQLYDAGKNLIATGRFDEDTQTIMIQEP